MRSRALSAIFIIGALLGGCAAPPAIQLASFAVDGAAYLATGKGSTDHALSMMADADCRLSNVVHGLDVCGTPNNSDEPAVAAALVEVPAQETSLEDAVKPAAGFQVSFQQSPGMNLAEVRGVPRDATLAGRVDAAGTLHVYLVAADGGQSETVLFSVPGYARTPGTFTGVVMGARFFAPESFMR